jgi:hypothetical protein
MWTMLASVGGTTVSSGGGVCDGTLVGGISDGWTAGVSVPATGRLQAEVTINIMNIRIKDRRILSSKRIRLIYQKVIPNYHVFVPAQ